MSFKMPPVTDTQQGAVRKVGFELEFTGLTLEQVIEPLCSILEGQVEQRSAVEFRVHTDDLGTFNLELDWDFLKRKAQTAWQEDDGHQLVDMLHQAALPVVPLEIVSPPIPLDQLEPLNQLIPALRKAGAKGTEDSLIAAFGVHINPELPDLSAATINRYLKAFALLQWWLVEAHDVDPTRRISPYIALYPEAYVKELLIDTSVDLTHLFDSYLKHNPTRNRALDLLPLLAEIDADRVRQVVDDPKIKSRPTFHYRLPDCRIEDADWDLTKSWDLWCVVEQLAADPQAIEMLAARFLQLERPLIGVERKIWVKEISQWLNDQGWV
ncbi:amidoligase family protein [Vibrio gazogenes]|uniref:Putative amidoligase enzyme n=1 Tax=Vibrio gazogenes DSM 21264 = NBRC 103151 TaxID=1123492 RepID=A0A1M4V740_VIBGA|nr:amidoligase family protein [Vibrio gazogenes]USP15605.1 amidoligase family protein [Vibrio gazogenes]SHE64785.1 Putative amidoligase enzyme [Vibrio gazogenes DSM 21264] [Vibrio gazogenes DSM 21264 = NBRC 103151]SJN54614.1 Putative amidoligase enzyme [Vibrio gazogenes]